MTSKSHKKSHNTRMHSSRMHTVRNSSRIQGGSAPRGVLSGPGGGGVSAPGGVLVVSTPRGVPGLGEMPGPGGGGVYSQGGCLVLGGCLVPGGVCSGGVSQHALRQTPPMWTDRHLLKHNLRNFVADGNDYIR